MRNVRVQTRGVPGHRVSGGVHQRLHERRERVLHLHMQHAPSGVRNRRLRPHAHHPVQDCLHRHQHERRQRRRTNDGSLTHGPTAGVPTRQRGHVHLASRRLPRVSHACLHTDVFSRTEDRGRRLPDLRLRKLTKHF